MECAANRLVEAAGDDGLLGDKGEHSRKGCDQGGTGGHGGEAESPAVAPFFFPPLGRRPPGPRPLDSSVRVQLALNVFGQTA